MSAMKWLLLHMTVYSAALVVGCEIVGLLCGRPDGYAVAYFGFMFGWPALIIASTYTEYVRRRS